LFDKRHTRSTCKNVSWTERATRVCNNYKSCGSFWYFLISRLNVIVFLSLLKQHKVRKWI